MSLGGGELKRATKKARNLQERERKKKDKVKKLRGQKKAKETKMKTIRLHERLNICVYCGSGYSKDLNADPDPGSSKN